VQFHTVRSCRRIFPSPLSHTLWLGVSDAEL
jgi:hypothetical protein